MPFFAIDVQRFGLPLALLLTLLLALTGCQSEDAKASQERGPNKLPAHLFVVQPSLIQEELPLLGSLMGYESVQIISEVAGRLEQIHIREGQRVAAGQLLFSLDKRDLAAQRKRLQAQLELAQNTAARQKALLDKQAVSQQMFDTAQSELEVLKAQIEEVDVAISKTEIRAPFAGTIGLRQVSPGAYITNATVLTTLQQTDALKLTFGVPERYAHLVRPGMQVRFQAPSSPDTLAARILATEPEVSAGSRSQRVRARVLQGRNLFPGQSAQVLLSIRTDTAGLLVPSECIAPKLDEKQVYLVKNGEVQPRTVLLGVRQKRVVEIEQGVAPGDTLLMTNILRARPGSPVEALSHQTIRTLEDQPPS